MFPSHPHRNRAPVSIIVEDELPDDPAVFGSDLEAIMVLDDSHFAHQSGPSTGDDQGRPFPVPNCGGAFGNPFAGQADTRFDQPQGRKPPSAESGNW